MSRTDQKKISCTSNHNKIKDKDEKNTFKKPVIVLAIDTMYLSNNYEGEFMGQTTFEEKKSCLPAWLNKAK